MRFDENGQPVLLSYVVHHDADGWHATYTGLMTKAAKAAGCEIVLHDRDGDELFRRAIRNRIKAQVWERCPDPTPTPTL
ncbi:hypothetical protein [Streptosporangium subroseum]|uniref:hypothetical protein n=1 Tax=Streptosporangium subroseum TaxID=106412 RepID=UPI003084C44E|nr:hypothetical protein OHB15_31495 [Streptosporangium subroseum]